MPDQKTSIRTLRPLLMGLLVAFLGLLGTAGLVSQLADSARNIEQARFLQAANSMTEALESRMDAYLEIAFGLRGLFVSNPALGRRAFDEAVSHLEIDRRFPEIKNVAFTRHVPSRERDVYEAQVRKDTSLDPQGYPKFTIHPPGERSEYFVADYLWPKRGNEGIFGLDISAQPANLASMRYSMRTARPVASGPFDLIQEKDHRTGFVIRVPVFSEHASLSDAKPPKVRFLGSVAVTLRVFDLLAQLAREGHQRGISFKLTDQGSTIADMPTTANLPLFSTPSSGLDSATRFSRDINVYGRKWQLAFEAQAPFSSAGERRVPALAAVSGAVVSLLLGTLVFLLARGQSTAEAQAQASDVARQDTEERWRFAIEGAGDGLWDWNVPAGTVFFSHRWKEVLGYSDDEIGNDFSEWSGRVHPDDLAPAMAQVEAHISGKIPFYVCEHRMRCKSGNWKWIQARGQIVTRDAQGAPLRVIGTHSDISERKASARVIESSLRDKEALLKEVHHRVKNNLQVITSLLRIEGRRHVASDIKAVLGDMQGRIRSMALLHGLLYQSGTYATINLGDYIRDVASQAFASQTGRRAKVGLQFDLASVQVNMDQAMPCGLLINEMISNCLKHGFPEGHAGDITVKLQPANGVGHWQMTVSDTGVGPPPDFMEKSRSSLGLQLISDLTEQLDGQLEMRHEDSGGMTVSISFFVRQPAKALAST